ncbi:MAG: energy transducer TonB [Alistipes sp.]|nr:energy transducer TonB [Alistipes sp.]
MKFLATLFLCIGLCGTAAAQELEPATYNHAAIKFFRSRLISEIQKVAVEQQCPYDDLSEHVVVAFRIDTLGHVSRWRFLDNTCDGRDHTEVEPASAPTRELVTAAFEKMDGEWQPARRGARKVPYNLQLRLRIPVDRIERALNPDPLLFQGENPDKSFYSWMRTRVRYDERFAKVGGKVHVRFFVEPDGGITIDEVVESPDAKLTKEVLRVIRSSRGKWTPRKVDGVAQRTPYEVRINYVNDSAE